jgi:DNA-binding Lrp family transcriptional regulator
VPLQEVYNMVRAYIMVKAYTGEADRLKTDITDIDGVERAHIVAGDVDIIAVVDVGSPAEVKDVAATHVQDIDGVEDTQTYIAMD